MARTDNINNFLTDVATAIRTKAGTVENIQASQFDTAIANIPSGGVYPSWKIPYKQIQSGTLTEDDFAFLSYVDFSEATTLANMFYYSDAIHSLPDISNISVPVGISYSNMFASCTNLETIKGTINLKTSNSCEAMFNNCSKLKSINFSLAREPGQSSNASCKNIFNNCALLETITSTGIQASTLYQAFMNCEKLVTLPQINGAGCYQFNYMCKNCTLLENVNSFDMSGTSAANYARDCFANCPSLTNESLNNIMYSLSTLPYAMTSTSPSSTKQLSYYGLSSTQATACTSLTNWQTLSDYGWVTGY